MQTLDKNLRNKLDHNIQEAREVAEEAARAALKQLGVGEAKPFKHFSEQQRVLRRKLRAYGRQLGDQRLSDDTQEIELLVEEVAYEHWHRMLFARFLAENNLLMYHDPESSVPVTLEECEELAEEEGARDGWELASHFATHMLPQIFRIDSPVFKLILPLEHQHKLERLLLELPVEVFTSSDSLGWVYQYWQTRKKEEIKNSEVKIGARELPAVTQLFTEPYMVNFLLDNALGAWWAARRLTEEELRNTENEEKLRQKASLPGVPLQYLRFVKDDEGVWTPAAGTFDQWPEHLGDLKVMDPCCGSGHFLVAAFHMLVPMRMEMEGMSVQEAVDVVLTQNLHGLEIDKRCVEIAAFNLALNAWRYPDAGGYRELPELNLACSGLSVSVPKKEWKKLANGDKNLSIALDWLYEEFQNAPVLGSLLDPQKSEAAKIVDWEQLSGAFEKALQKERTQEEYEAGVAAQGLAKNASLLTNNYHLIITNVPYLGMRRMNKYLYEYCDNCFPNSKQDIATVFIERFRSFSSKNISVCLVSPQSWLMQPAYEKFRKYIINSSSLRMIVQLGENGFESPQAAGAFVSLSIFDYNCVDILRFSAIKALEEKSPEEKSIAVIGKDIRLVSSYSQYKNPQHKISFEAHSQTLMINNLANAPQGIKTGDDEMWVRYFWEIHIFSDWGFVQSSVNIKTLFGGREKVICWSTNGYGMIRPRLNSSALNRWGVAISQTRNKAATLYTGHKFLSTVAPVVPFKNNFLKVLWEYCSSNDFRSEVSKISPGLFSTNSSILVTPIDYGKWEIKAMKIWPHNLPYPFSDDPTQWVFHGHPCGSVVFNEKTGLLEQGLLRINHTVLQVSVARLLGYRWPAELDSEMELSKESREWVEKCQELLPHSDKDGIVCIPPVRGEAPAADRLLNLLAASYGEEWNMEILQELLKQAGHAGKTLETWLRDKYFTQHCKLFHHRPFIWHIWDGLRDGFSALVNYNKLDRKNLEALIYTYLGDWINRKKQDKEQGIDGAEEKLAAAKNLKKRLELILEGEKPYDIFVRWKPIEKQPIGWEPDLNDGVRLNIRPFMKVPSVGKKGAGVLRDRPNIKWKKDRGKDVESAPWHHVFKGERINDYHLELKEKNEASKTYHLK